MIAPLFALTLLAPSLTPPAQHTDGTVPGERYGQANPISRPISRALRAAQPALATAREGYRFGYRLGLPEGRYTVELGLGELLMKRPGQRIFSVSLNGATVHEEIDLVLLGGPAPSVQISTHEVEIEGDAGLDVAFTGSRYKATASWLRVTGGEVDLFVDCGGENDLASRAESAPIGEAILARFGSRFFLDLRPQFRELETSPLGKFAEEPAPAIIGFRTRQGRYPLPFLLPPERGGGTPPVRERRSLSSVTYEVEFEGCKGEVTFWAPFHPGDRDLSSLPAFYVDYTLTREQDDAPDQVWVEFYLTLKGLDGRIVDVGPGQARGVVGRKVTAGLVEERGLFVAPGEPKPQTAVAKEGIWLSLPIGGGAGGVGRRRIVYAGHAPGPVLRVHDEPHRFEYTERYATIEEVAAAAFARRSDAERAAKVMNDLVIAFPPGLRDLLFVAFPSFLLNTWWTVGEDGERWYSCLEGYCRYHSTIDVEYNAAPFYLWFAPDLLKSLLEAWTRFERPEGFLCHDMGKDGVVGEQVYSHDMPVEENVNYVLLLHQYWVATADEEFAVARFDLVKRLLEFIEKADKDGDGFAEEGVANTIDDASPAIQFSREQSYLGVKSAAAFVAGAEIADAAEAPEIAKRYRERAELIRRTLDEHAWLDDHYAVCLDRNATGLVDPWGKDERFAGEEGEGQGGAETSEELEGWDAAHPYTSIGLPYLLRAGIEPPIDRDRLRVDLRTAAERAGRRFGTAHSDGEENVWVSLNLFRDAVACYLGDDVLDRTSQYAELQRYRSRAVDMRHWSGFCDSPFNRYLSYYPRGVAAFLLADAAAGVQFDRRSRMLRFRPVRVPYSVPLPYLADWDDLRVPWLHVRLDADGKAGAVVTEPDLLEGWDVRIDLSLVEKADEPR